MSRERLHCKVLGRGEVLMKLMLAQSFGLLAHMGTLLSSNFDWVWTQQRIYKIAKGGQGLVRLNFTQGGRPTVVIGGTFRRKFSSLKGA